MMSDPLLKPAPAVLVLNQVKTTESPFYDIILLDDDYHSYDYVIEMLHSIFGHSSTTAFEMACEVDNAGFVVVGTTHKQEAAEKRRAIEAYGPDWRMDESEGSMSAFIEPTGKL